MVRFSGVTLAECDMPSTSSPSPSPAEETRAIPEGVLEGDGFASVREVVVELVKLKGFNERLINLLPARPESFPLFQTSCTQILDSVQKFHRVVFFGTHRLRGRKDSSPAALSTEVLLVAGFFRMALKVFTWWSLFPPCPFFVPFMDQPESPQFAAMRSLCFAGGYLLAGLLQENERLRMLLWKSPLFLNALKAVVTKVRVTSRENKTEGEYVGRLTQLLMDLCRKESSDFSLVSAMSEEVVRSLNESNPAGKEGGGTPIDFTHLIRAALWAGRSNNLMGSPVVYWGTAVESLGAIALKGDFFKAAQNAFASSDANGDAMDLFTRAISDFDTSPRSLQDFTPRMRAGALTVTLHNAAVAKHVMKQRQKLLEKMRRFREAVDNAGLEIPSTINALCAWLEANVPSLQQKEKASSAAVADEDVKTPNLFDVANGEEEEEEAPPSQGRGKGGKGGAAGRKGKKGEKEEERGGKEKEDEEEDEAPPSGGRGKGGRGGATGRKGKKGEKKEERGGKEKEEEKADKAPPPEGRGKGGTGGGRGGGVGRGGGPPETTGNPLTKLLQAMQGV
uniref:Uncharacterized protein n=1 Tax=Chromera velia CCMP2878 TaxID=1169474 RepID=A0A0G4IDA2_9ALVE|eukprot:Cvel_13342.t1-p1 / transcript=Cvel_13342.t1 / gene=Cvel_13342 / organism=Chromera_velia_CCMP2878 / gene_product=hypothetical protein / transcript_product=hypothetical protein / location=Cvel_scaffold906:19402-28050(-) / protein_length=563 / sequence_SO=supercontig / SO=protein_coding / is_pseudo=false